MHVWKLHVSYFNGRHYYWKAHQQAFIFLIKWRLSWAKYQVVIVHAFARYVCVWWQIYVFYLIIVRYAAWAWGVDLSTITTTISATSAYSFQELFTMCQEGTTEGYENKRNANDADVPSSRTTMTCLYMANERMYSISSLGECKRNQYPLLFFDSSYLVKKHIPRWNEFMTSYDIRLIIISICLCWYVRLMLLLLLLLPL